MYDAADGYVLLFGGGTTSLSGNGELTYGDTWTYANGIWTNLTGNLTQSPSVRSDPGIAYDAADGYVVMFGGEGGPAGTVALNDTWTFHAGVWTNITATAGAAPSGRGAVGMTYDAADGYVLMFGGCFPLDCSISDFADTWTFSAGSWHKLSPATSPAARGSLAMAYDPIHQEVVLFGGRNSGNVRFGDTWTFAGGVWTNVTGGTAPLSRLWAAFTFDPALGGLALFGGDRFGSFDQDTWVFSGGNWTDITASVGTPPGARGDGQLAYDPSLSGALLFGGQEGPGVTYGDTWLLETRAASNSTQYIVSVSIFPSFCGPVALGSGAVLSDGQQANFTSGTYLMAGLTCPGWVFANWTATGSVSLLSAVNDSAVVLLVSGDGAVTASYLPAPPPVVEAYVTVSLVPTSCGPAYFGNGVELSSGAQVEVDLGFYLVSALPCTNMTFVSWNATGDVLPETGLGTPSLIVHILGNASLKASYIPTPPPPPPILELVGVVVVPAACGPVTITPNVTATNGTLLTLVAGVHLLSAPACAGYAFSDWTASGEMVLEDPIALATNVLNVTGPGTLTAVYLPEGGNATSTSGSSTGGSLTEGLVIGVLVGAAAGITVGLLARRGRAAPPAPPPPR